MPRPRLEFDRWPAVLYAIGDVHGCLSQLLAIEQQIRLNATEVTGEKWIVMLGDYIDRGPDSARVVEHLLRSPPEGFRRFCLVGNHEQMMEDFAGDPVEHSYWLDQGGFETLLSYGVHAEELFGLDEAGLRGSLAHVPDEHLEFMRGLPVCLTLPGWIFVHAGLRPGLAVTDQSDEDMIWIREPFLSSPLPNAPRVVHGHTPGREPVVNRHRICVDTQCFLTGRLTAVRIVPTGEVSFLSTAEPPPPESLSSSLNQRFQ